MQFLHPTVYHLVVLLRRVAEDQRFSRSRCALAMQEVSNTQLRYFMLKEYASFQMAVRCCLITWGIYRQSAMYSYPDLNFTNDL